MGGKYYTELPDILRDAGVNVGVGSQNAGWETRARSSGGWSAAPLAVFWHHTASQTSIENDLAWQCHNCPDKPVGNMTIDRSGTVWPVAAGASNCAGKGGPASFSRGVIPLDKGNTMGWQIEVANNGVGEPWPVAQIDAYFASSNALNAYFGNQPTDVITHHVWAPTRKIDPATASAVEGFWQPRSTNSSGTWNLDDIRAECAARAATGPGPTPPGDDDDMIFDSYWRRNNDGAVFAIFKNGTKTWVGNEYDLAAGQNWWTLQGASAEAVSVRVMDDPALFSAMGVVVGPLPADGINRDGWGNRTDVP